MKTIFENIRSIIALSFIFLSFGFIYMIAIKKVPPENVTIVNIASGIVLGGLPFLMGYYFGSSKNETTKMNSEITLKKNDSF